MQSLICHADRLPACALQQPRDRAAGRRQRHRLCLLPGPPEGAGPSIMWMLFHFSLSWHRLHACSPPWPSAALPMTAVLERGAKGWAVVSRAKAVKGRVGRVPTHPTLIYPTLPPAHLPLCATQNPHMASSSPSFHYYSFNFGCAPGHARPLVHFAVPRYSASSQLQDVSCCRASSD